MFKILVGLFCICIVGLNAEFVIPKCLGVFFCTEFPRLDGYLTIKNGTSGSFQINKDIVTEICSYLLTISTCIDTGVPTTCAAYTKLYTSYQNVVTTACNKNIQDVMAVIDGFNELGGPEQEDFMNCMGKHDSENSGEENKCSVLQRVKTCNHAYFSSRSPDAMSNIDSFIDQYNDDMCYLRSFLDGEE
ncbi:uncharacterized protein LOC143049395 isoform X2 [Mytilus galloprovincialis]|uniref:uncharacterized protein LOC143049395 isoform X2 n=1 Tax=Mytilus galloprovincialis TaxID=29158 RepID=UPI003F7C7727